MHLRLYKAMPFSVFSSNLRLTLCPTLVINKPSPVISYGASTRVFLGHHWKQDVLSKCLKTNTSLQHIWSLLPFTQLSPGAKSNCVANVLCLSLWFLWKKLRKFSREEKQKKTFICRKASWEVHSSPQRKSTSRFTGSLDFWLAGVFVFGRGVHVGVFSCFWRVTACVGHACARLRWLDSELAHRLK